ncbi:MAG: 2-oxoglutarate dehydrogenase E1 component [Chlamydiae bacterium]|nr:2-oxoglutarate dehydrogenase E1 component [Chlamydiota bacterium]
MEKKNKHLSFTQLNNYQFVEDIYEQYLENPQEIDTSWRRFFEGMEFAQTYGASNTFSDEISSSQRELQLIEAYRTWGFQSADIDPIALEKRESPSILDIHTYGFTDSSAEVSTHGLLAQDKASIADLEDHLKKLYASRVGFEFKHITNPELIAFIQERVEKEFIKSLSLDDKMQILHFLNRAEILESFIHTKYVGQKRFSIEGLDTFIPIIRGIVDQGAEKGVEEIVICMAHRGRLNLLANIFEKPYAFLFREFSENYEPTKEEGSGDVKYHKGYSADIESRQGKRMHISIPPNSSHLESVNAIALGQVRAKQVHKEDVDRSRILAIQVHGDASVAGQGVIYEGMQLCHLEGFETGGSIHIVMDNQIGFTTLPKEDRSTPYPTDIGKAFDTPIFHVNAEDPEGCLFATYLAVEVRQKFKCDVFIHLNGYRKYGHNEGDEPAYTQPLQYRLIRAKKSIREIYRDQLINEGVLEKKTAEQEEIKFKDSLQQALVESQNLQGEDLDREKLFGNRWGYWKESRLKSEDDLYKEVQTHVQEEILKEIVTKITEIPQDFTPHKKIAQLLGMRRAAVLEEQKQAVLDWGLVENLAYASLLYEEFSIRLAGQDSERGTFSHRHAVIVDQKKSQKYIPLNNLKEGQGKFVVYNSPLSEYACLGFEYGYSISTSKGLVLWEAQFGDFANGGQIIIDAYISGGEEKWNRLSNLILLLPHGYEGQGPEHSSARVERFLQLAGNKSMLIAMPSTPAQMFHLLRRQALKYYRKPLIVFTPKKLLRHPKCVSSLKDLSTGSFQEVIDDPMVGVEARVLIFCTGKIYYDLLDAREKNNRKDLVFIRVEQLYPVHQEKLQAIIEKYQACEKCFWVQEEPKNMGAWYHIQPILKKHLPKSMPLKYCGRPRSASTAEGFHKGHQRSFEKLMKTLFNEESK